MNITTFVFRVAPRPGTRTAGKLERRLRRLIGIASQHIASIRLKTFNV
jgi:hypothetical protein